MRFVFDWDPGKAKRNRAKHKISFEEAMTIFYDPMALTIYDDDHSADEDRWVTLGLSRSTRLLLVVHTHIERSEDEILIRLISARRPTQSEARQYEQGIKP